MIGCFGSDISSDVQTGVHTEGVPAQPLEPSTEKTRSRFSLRVTSLPSEASGVDVVEVYEPTGADQASVAAAMLSTASVSSAVLLRVLPGE